MRIEIEGTEVLNSVDFQTLNSDLRFSEYFLDVAEKNPNKNVQLINDKNEIIGWRKNANEIISSL